jgi:hypothetical protein
MLVGTPPRNQQVIKGSRRNCELPSTRTARNVRLGVFVFWISYNDLPTPRLLPPSVCFALSTAGGIASLMLAYTRSVTASS